MQFRYAAPAAALVTFSIVAAAMSRTPEPLPPPETMAELQPDEPPLPVVRQVSHTIAAGEVFGRIAPEYGLSAPVLQEAASPWYDLAKLRAGKDLVFVYLGDDPIPVEVRYALDADRTLVLSREGIDEAGAATWSGRMDAITYDTLVGRRCFTVERTLWGAATEAGLAGSDIAALAAVFEFDLDFNTEIRAGATVDMVVEELWLDGGLARLGAPLAARLTNVGKEYLAIRYTRADGTTRYFDDEGTARKKAFLRSPLQFTRVTSGFSKGRYHPVLKRKRPHLGVDYGAPTGTPVRAVGDGKVEMAKTSGGHGKYVKIDHEGPYESSYSHLSRIAVKAGQRVSQGQVVGYVGSTGLATGPHLHFQMWVNGKYVNPLSLELPRNEKLPASEMAGFRAERDRVLDMLDDTAVADDTPPSEPTPG